MEKQSYWLPLLLILAGGFGALYVLFLVFSPFGPEYVIGFALACLVGAVGWNELRETDRFNEEQGAE